MSVNDGTRRKLGLVEVARKSRKQKKKKNRKKKHLHSVAFRCLKRAPVLKTVFILLD